MQNNYNNYLKRQKQASTNNFKEKIKNSLSGKAVNNTTMPNTTQSVIQNKVKAMTPNTGSSTNTIGSGSASGVVTPPNNANNINTKTITPNSLEGQINASETPSTINITTPVVENPIQSSDVVNEGGGGAGLMSLSEINSALAPNTTNPNARTTNTTNPNARTVTYNPLDPNAIVPGTGGMTQAEYEAEVKRKQEAGIALDNQELYQQYLNASTPYKYAEQILQSQKEQADKNWQLQEQMFNQQQQNLKDQYNQSVKDAENAYNKSVDTLNEQRYNQREEMNVSGTKRGIQYSPQQLGLENVANINHNKNLAEASNSRNELLNKLQIEMNNSLAQLNMSHLQSYNSYQENIMKYQTDYYNQLMNWNREDSKTQSERDWEQKLLEEKRKWEEEQAQKDKDFQQQMQELQNQFDKEMQNSQNNWQSGENALDRTHETNLNNSRSASGGYSGYSGGGYSRGYSNYSRSYNPYTYSYGGYSNYDGGSVDLGDDIESRAYQSVFNDVSDDAYNAYTSLTSPYNAYSRAMGYASEVDGMIEDAKRYGASESTLRKLYDTRDRAMKQLFEDHSGYDNYNGDLVARGDDKVNYYKKYVTNSLDKMKTRHSEDVMKKIRASVKEDKNKSNNKSTSQNKKTSIVKENTKKAVSNSVKNVKTSVKNAKENSKKATQNSAKNAKTSVKNAAKNNKTAVANAKKNAKTSVKNAKNNTKKAISNAKNNTKKSTNNALNNLKKNISKLFKKKK